MPAPIGPRVRAGIAGGPNGSSFGIALIVRAAIATCAGVAKESASVLGAIAGAAGKVATSSGESAGAVSGRIIGTPEGFARSAWVGAGVSSCRDAEASNTWVQAPQRTWPPRADSCASVTRNAVLQVGQRVIMRASPR